VHTGCYVSWHMKWNTFILTYVVPCWMTTKQGAMIFFAESQHIWSLETIYTSKEWDHQSSSKSKKFTVAPLQGEVILTIFWYMKGGIVTDFLQNGPTTNSGKSGSQWNLLLHQGYWVLYDTRLIVQPTKTLFTWQH